MNIPILDLKAQYAPLREEILAAIERVMESQHFILGPEVEALENEIASYSGCQHGIGVSSGTDALLVSLMAAGIHPGDEVITSAYSFFATAGSIVRLGAHPVFVDVDCATLNIDATQIEGKITPKTRAILPVHLAGQMADMDLIRKIANRHNLFIIEDACQALGSEYKGKRAGSIGHLGCFSFFPSKNLGGAGDSGMVVSNDSILAERIKLLRNHGHQPKYYNKIVGGNFRMDALQAAMLRVKLPYLEGWIAARQRNAAYYQQLFSETGLVDDAIHLPHETGWGRHVYHLFQLRVQRRDALAEYLKKNSIGCEIYYPVPLHLQECFKDLGYKQGDYPNAEHLAHETLALPIYPELNKPMMETIVQVINNFYTGKK
jgi:dTDP-4-amino-4,6-dideoxygalactose transaminase